MASSVYPGTVVGADGQVRMPTSAGSTAQSLRLSSTTGLLEWFTPGGGGDALVANPLSQFAATTSAQLAGVIIDETGTGALVFANSPTFVTPALGTPASGNLANCTFPTLNQNTTGTAAGLSATLAVASGGTGLTALGTALQVLRTNAGGTAMEWSTPSAGGGITINSTAITSGAVNRVLFENGSNQVSQTSGFTFNGTLLTVPAGLTVTTGNIKFAGNLETIAGKRVAVVAGSSVYLGDLDNMGGSTYFRSRGDTFMSATGFSLVFAGNMTNTASHAGANLSYEMRNTSNTASSNAYLSCAVGGTSGGNAYTVYSVPSTWYWFSGLDNSDDSFKITGNATNTFPGTPALTISTAGKTTFQASTTSAASLNVPSGTAPTSPVDGDIWSDGSDILVRLGGTTYTLNKT